MSKGKKALNIIHIMILLYFIVGPLLLAIAFYIGGSVGLGNASTGIFILSALLYWFYGVDYFEVEWLQELKKGKKIQNNSSV